MQLPTDMARIAPVTEDRNYSDVIAEALAEAAAMPEAAGYIGALETASGQLSRAFASAQVTGAGIAAFTPDVMSQIGRSLVEAGEAVWFRRAGQFMRAWEYTEGRAGSFEVSTRNTTYKLPANRVFRVQWNLEEASGRGLGPLGTARTLRSLIQRLETSLSNEARASVGYLLPVPADGGASTVDALKKQLGQLKGDIAIAETTAAAWGDGPSAAPRRDFQLARLGPMIPDSSVRLFQVGRDAVLSACGYPVSLANDADGTAQREAWRRYLHGTVAPLGRLVEAAARRVGLGIMLDFDALFASDISGRARAFQSLVGGGMDVAQAAALSGLLNE